MKKLLFVLVLVGAVTLANAQSPINVGVKIGGNFANIDLESSDPSFDAGDLKSQFGFVGGGFVRINLGKISIQPEVLYSQKKFKEEAEGFTTEYTLNELDVPVLIGYDLVDAKLVKLRLMAGPVASINLSNEIGGGDVDISGDEVDELFESARFGYSVGLSLDVTKLTFDLRYNGSFSDTFDPEQIGLNDLKSTTSWISATVGFKFL